MKKHFFLLLFVACAVFAQAPKTGSELVAEGKAKVKVKPDVVTLKVDVRKRNDVEAEALKALNTETTALKQYLVKSGVPDKAIKIAEYSVSSNDRYNSSAPEKKSYTASASLTIEMQLDNKLLDMVYTELQLGKYQDVSVNYTTGLSEELQKATSVKLLEKAIADARANADNMAKALGVNITGVKSISKSGNNERYYKGSKSYEYVSRSPRYMDGTVLGNTELTEKEVEEEVTIIYEISK